MKQSQLSTHFWATVCYQTVVRLSVLSVCLSVCDVGVLWPNGWMDQDETWHGGRSRPHWRPSSSPKKGAQLPIFGPCPLWPNGHMDQHAAWYGGRPRPMPHCVRWGSSSSERAQQPPLFDPCLLWPNDRPS